MFIYKQHGKRILSIIHGTWHKFFLTSIFSLKVPPEFMEFWFDVSLLAATFLESPPIALEQQINKEEQN